MRGNVPDSVGTLKGLILLYVIIVVVELNSLVAWFPGRGTLDGRYRAFRLSSRGVGGYVYDSDEGVMLD